MKKITVLLMVLVLTASFALTACGGGASSSSDSSAALQEIVDEAQGSLDTLKASLGDTMDIDITARGTALVYTFSFLTDAGDADLLKDGLEQGIEAQASFYESMLDAMKESGIDGASIIIEYLDMDGNEIYTKEFK